MEKNLINESEFKAAYENLNCVLGEILVLSDDYLFESKNVFQAVDVNEKILHLADEIRNKISEMEKIAKENEIELCNVED